MSKNNYWNELEKITNKLLKDLLKLQKGYVKELRETFESERTLTPKTVRKKIKYAETRWNEKILEIKKRYRTEQKKVFKKILELAKQEEDLKFQFGHVEWDRINTLADVGLKFMDNYKIDMINKIKTQLYLSLINGESFKEAYKRIKPLGNNKARPSVMIRDQMSRIAQEAITQAYIHDEDREEYEYYWTGPTDKRTTKICMDRKSKNPYTYEEMKKLDPHPHIQCRHRWVRKPKVLNKKK